MPRRPRVAGVLSLVLIGLVVAATGLTMADGITGSDSAGQGARRHQHEGVRQTSWDPITPVSVSGTGQPGDGESSAPVVASDNPTVVAFASTADHLTDDDGNGRRDVFVVDHGTLTKVSGDFPCSTSLGVTAGPALSGSGNVIAYAVACQGRDGQRTTTLLAQDRTTGATQVVTPVTPAAGVDHVVLSYDGHVLVWDQTGDVYGTRLDAGPPAVVLVSADVDGHPTGTSSDPSVASDGRCVVFASRSTRLVTGDVDGVSDVFLRTGSFTADPADDSIVMISRAADGSPADGASSRPSVSGDCRRIAYVTLATNVVPGGNGTGGIVLADRPSGTTVRVTTTSGPNGEPVISADGRHVAFTGADGPPGQVPSNFDVFDRAATPFYGSSIVNVDGPRVRVGFPAGVDLAAVTGGSVEGGALIDDQVVPLNSPDGRSNTNPLGTVGATVPQVPPVPPATDLTDGPDLVSARVVADDNSTPADRIDDTTAVRFCFDAPVAAVAGPPRGDGTIAVTTARFLIQGYDSLARQVSTDAAVEPGADGVASRCVRARFPRDADVGAYTIAAVLDRAVADGTGRVNVKGSCHLGGERATPRPGDITGPNLRAVQPNLLANQAVYTFDRILGTVLPVSEAAGGFHFVDGDGHDHAGRAVAAVDRKAATVTVEFAPDTDSLVTARRFVVLPDAVRNDGGGRNVMQSTDGDVAGPQLISAARVGTTGAVYDFTFSAAVTGTDVARFLLAAEDGTTFPVASTEAAGPKVVRVRAPAVERFAGSIVLGIVEAGAVSETVGGILTSRPGRGAPNAPAAKPIAVSAAAAGALSDGPDLVAVEPRPADHTVDYLFDEPVRDVHLLPADPEVPTGPTAVFAADLDRGVVERVSVDGAGRPLAGPSSSPSISARGGIVVFVSAAALLPGTTNRLPQIFVRNLLSSAVSPGSADFGAVVVGAHSDRPAGISVTNHGNADLPVAVALTGNALKDFGLVDDACSGRTLAPGETCTVGVVFAPSAAGVRSAGLVITDDAPGSPHTVPLVGFAGPATPILTVSPRVGRPGSVAVVSGQGFPPGAHLSIRVSAAAAGPGPLPAPSGGLGGVARLAVVPGQIEALRADRDGRFRGAPLLVVSGHLTGPLVVEVEADRPRVSARVTFLVAPGSVQPAVPRTPGHLPEVRYRR